MSKKSIKLDPEQEGGELEKETQEIFKKHKRFTLSKTLEYTDPNSNAPIDPPSDEVQTRSGSVSTTSTKQRINLKRSHPKSIGTDSSDSEKDSSSETEEKKQLTVKQTHQHIEPDSKRLKK